MREVKIRFFSLSVFQFFFENFDNGREVYQFIESQKAVVGPDPDLTSISDDLKVSISVHLAHLTLPFSARAPSKPTTL